MTVVCKLSISVVLAFSFSGLSRAESPTTAPFQTLDGIDEELQNLDLRSFGEIAEQSEIIGLGEATHGSGGFNQAKFRLIKYLVEEKGYRFVAMETPWQKALIATRYVNHCIGSSTDAIKSLYEIYQDKNIQNFLTWMCEFNRGHQNDQVVFFGMDTKVLMTREIIDFLHKNTPESYLSIEHGVKQCIGKNQFQSYAEFKSSPEYADIMSGAHPIEIVEKNACLEALAKVDDFILKRQDPSDFEIGLAVLSLVTTEKSLFTHDPNDPIGIVSQNERDLGIYHLFQRLRKHFSLGKKGIVWAHDAHVQMKSISIDGPPLRELKFFGSWLNDELGGKYSPFSLSGYRVETKLSEGLGQYPEYPEKDSFESIVHANIGQEYLFIDFQNAFFEIGQSYRFRGGDMVPIQSFKGMIYLDHSPAPQPID